ncbi:MAG: hypothetical protein ACJAUH_001053 [Saprospiraceae bacterium]|jgi:hypothetical protein
MVESFPPPPLLVRTAGELLRERKVYSGFIGRKMFYTKKRFLFLCDCLDILVFV